MKIKSVTTYQEFITLKNDWNNLFKKVASDNIFVTWEWFRIWIEHFGSQSDFFILIITDKNELIGIAPFKVNKGGVLSNKTSDVSFFSDDLIADYMDFLIYKDHEEIVSLIVDYLINLKKWKRIILRRLPEWSGNVKYIRNALSKFKYKQSFHIVSRSPYIQIIGSFENYFSSISRNLRQDIRTTVNKIKKIGTFSFEIINQHDFSELFKQLFLIHEKRQKIKSGESIFNSDKYREFLFDIAMEFSMLDMSEITVLKINNRIVSFVYALKLGEIYYYWIPAIDPEYNKFSLGKLHLKFLLQKCFKEKIRIFDFMIGDEPYKLQWAKNSFKNYEIKIFRSRILYIFDSLIYIIYNLFRKIIHRNLFLNSLWIKLSKVKFFAKFKELV